jgi:hypothetical protein
VSRPKRRRKPARTDAELTFWGPDEVMPNEPPLIPVDADPTALVTSLGPLPLPIHQGLASAQLDAVYRRAAQLAVAVAAAGQAESFHAPETDELDTPADDEP